MLLHIFFISKKVNLIKLQHHLWMHERLKVRIPKRSIELSLDWTSNDFVLNTKTLDEPVAKLPLADMSGEALVKAKNACLLSKYITPLSGVDVPTALPDFPSSSKKSCFIDFFIDASDAPRLEEGFNHLPTKYKLYMI